MVGAEARASGPRPARARRRAASARRGCGAGDGWAPGAAAAELTATSAEREGSAGQWLEDAGWRGRRGRRGSVCGGVSWTTRCWGGYRKESRSRRKSQGDKGGPRCGPGQEGCSGGGAVCVPVARPKRRVGASGVGKRVSAPDERRQPIDYPGWEVALAGGGGCRRGASGAGAGDGRLAAGAAAHHSGLSVTYLSGSYPRCGRWWWRCVSLFSALRRRGRGCRGARRRR